MSALVHYRLPLPCPQRDDTGPGWCDIWAREGTSDEDVIHETFIEDTYRLRGLDLKSRSGTVIDVGANIGCVSALALQYGAANVVAVEPEPANLELLRRNMAPWNARGERVRVIPMAVGGADGSTRIVGSAGTAHAALGGDGPSVEMISLRSLIEGVDDPILLLKMDIEGGEYEAINLCAPRTLARCERIHMEWHGPKTAAHLHRGQVDQWYGEMMRVLAESFSVTVFGSTEGGGMLFAHVNDR